MVAERFDDAYIPDIIPKDDLDYMDQGGYGARMGWGERPAVLVVDMLEIFASSDHLGRSESSVALFQKQSACCRPPVRRICRFSIRGLPTMKPHFGITVGSSMRRKTVRSITSISTRRVRSIRN